MWGAARPPNVIGASRVHLKRMLAQVRTASAHRLMPDDSRAVTTSSAASKVLAAAHVNGYGIACMRFFNAFAIIPERHVSGVWLR